MIRKGFSIFASAVLVIWPVVQKTGEFAGFVSAVAPSLGLDPKYAQVPWWIPVSVAVLMLFWGFFPSSRESIPRDDETSADKPLGNDQSINIDTMIGGTVAPTYNNITTTVVAPSRLELNEEGYNDLARELKGRKAIVTIVGDKRCQEIGERTIKALTARGIQCQDFCRTGMLAPPPSGPYVVNSTENEGEATLVISPTTLP